MKVPQFEPWVDDMELKLLTECIRDNWITGGPKVHEFEQKIAELCDVKYSVACVNGTMALFMGLKALDIKEGDEVIVPDFTFIASANAVVLAGGTPIFIDVTPNTLNMSTYSLRNAITKKTKAIMPVHIYGQSADMSLIGDIAKLYGIPVIEDAAQGVGVTWLDRPVGGFGQVGCLSFYADKTLTTGEGGMVLTNDKDIYEKCLRLSHQGNLGKGVYIHETIGYNFRMTDLQAAIGLAQLKKLPSMIQLKRHSDVMYRRLLDGIVKFTTVDSRCFNVPFRIVIFVDDPVSLSNYLQKNDIGTRPVFYPLHKQPCYATTTKTIDKDCPNSIWAYEHGLALPSSAKLTTEQIEYVCDKIRELNA